MKMSGLHNDVDAVTCFHFWIMIVMTQVQMFRCWHLLYRITAILILVNYQYLLQWFDIQELYGEIITFLEYFMKSWMKLRRPANAQASLHIRAVTPEPSLFAHMKYGSRRKVRPKIRHLAPLDVCTCAFEEWVYGGRKVPKSHELAQVCNFSAVVGVGVVTVNIQF